MPIHQNDLHTWSQIRDLYQELELISERIEMEFGCLRRAKFNSRPYREGVTALVKAFIRKSSLENLAILATAVDNDLTGKGFSTIEQRLLKKLEISLMSASKDREAFITACEAFFNPA